MIERKQWLRGFFAIVGVVFSVCTLLYSFLHNILVQKNSTLALGDMCVPPENAKKTDTNPNRDLFISCGGFLE